MWTRPELRRHCVCNLPITCRYKAFSRHSVHVCSRQIYIFTYPSKFALLLGTRSCCYHHLEWSRRCDDKQQLHFLEIQFFKVELTETRPAMIMHELHSPRKSVMALTITSPQPGCLLDSVFKLTAKKTSHIWITGPLQRESSGNQEIPVAVRFPSQMASIAERVSMSWFHHLLCQMRMLRVDDKIRRNRNDLTSTPWALSQYKEVFPGVEFSLWR